MGSKGGVVLSERLNKLEAALREYYGAINELRMGLNTKVPPKPPALVQYERCQALGIPLVAGGVIDQPYEWLQEIAVIIEQKTLFELLEKRQREIESDAP